MLAIFYNDSYPHYLCLLTTFIKKNSCLVAKTVSFDTTGLHVLIFHVLESFPSTCIAVDLCHVISH